MSTNVLTLRMSTNMHTLPWGTFVRNPSALSGLVAPSKATLIEHGAAPHRRPPGVLPAGTSRPRQSPRPGTRGYGVGRAGIEPATSCVSSTAVGSTGVPCEPGKPSLTCEDSPRSSQDHQPHPGPSGVRFLSIFLSTRRPGGAGVRTTAVTIVVGGPTHASGARSSGPEESVRIASTVEGAGACRDGPLLGHDGSGSPPT